MLELTLLVSPVLIGLASLPANELLVGALPVQPTAEPAAAPVTKEKFDLLAFSPAGAPSSLYGPIGADPLRSTPNLLADDGLRHSRFTIKGGLFSPDADEYNDDGWIVNASWMRFFTSLLALEVEVGYFDVSGEESGVDTDIWGAPLMVNGRANIPLWILDLYGGLGVGTIYYDAEASAAGLTADDDGFLLAGNAFLGATINLADSIALGLEGKYYLTEDIDDFDESLDAFALMLTLGFSR